MRSHIIRSAFVIAALTASGLLSVGVGVTSSLAAARSAEKSTPSTFVGLDGIEARWVIQENDRKGTNAWRIANTPKHNTIAGFANRTYATKDQSVALYVSTTAKSFRVYAFRMGYYRGSGGRLVWSSQKITGEKQPPCPRTAGTNMVACDSWKASLTVAISRAFVQGDYLFKLVGSDNEQSYIPLTISDPTSTATYVIKNDVFTWQGWNDFGGYDYYQGVGRCAPTYPVCNRARVVSFDRPYAYGNGAADFLSEEFPLVLFAERHGLDVTYVTDISVEQDPALLARHRVLLSLGHDECWSYGERVAVQQASAKGLNVVFFGASAMLRHVRLQPSALGPDREQVDYRNSTEDPLDGKVPGVLVTGNTWSSPPARWPESGFVGESYAGYLEPNAKHVPLVVAKASSWVFRGTHLHAGSKVPGIIASDFDTFEANEPHPSNVEILAHSPVALTNAQTNLGGKVFADMTYYSSAQSHAGVFDFGTNNWIPAMWPCAHDTACPAHVLGVMTGNVLRVFGYGPAGRIQPSKSS